MPSILRRLFSKTHPLVQIARAGNSVEFARLFLKTQFLALSLPIPDSGDPHSMTEEEFLKMVRKAAVAVKEQARFTLFTYPEESTDVLPLFTTHKAVDRFVGDYVTAVGRIIPFEYGVIRGEVIAGKLGSVSRVVIDPRNSGEYVLTDQDLANLVYESQNRELAK